MGPFDYWFLTPFLICAIRPCTQILRHLQHRHSISEASFFPRSSYILPRFPEDVDPIPDRNTLDYQMTQYRAILWPSRNIFVHHFMRKSHTSADQQPCHAWLVWQLRINSDFLSTFVLSQNAQFCNATASPLLSRLKSIRRFRLILPNFPPGLD